jgi:hypothetical protein
MEVGRPYLMTRGEVEALLAVQRAKRETRLVRLGLGASLDPGRAAAEEGEWVLAVMRRVWDGVNIYEGEGELRRGLGLASVGQVAVYAVLFSDSEICNGGFHQYFYNSTGILAQEALAGFRLVGSPERAELLRHAMSRFAGGVAPRDLQSRRNELDAIDWKTEWKPFARPLEDAYYALARATSVTRHCARLIQEQPEHFFG